MADESMKGRVAIVTGAGKGLGKAYAKLLAQRGCSVVVNNRIHPGVASTARALVEEITAAGGKAVAHEGPVDDPAAAQDMIQTALREFGRLDILVCNAGVMPEGPFAEAGIEDLERTVEANIWGTVHPLQAAWRHMIGTGYGRIVVSGSSVGLYGHPGGAIYGTTRSAMVGLARSVALEAPEGSDIRINVINPLAYTPMSSKQMDRNQGAEVASNKLPTEKVAVAVAFLCSEACTLTGAIFHAGGGRVSRAAIVESQSIPVEDLSMEAVANLSFADSLANEPKRATGVSNRMLAG